METQTGIPEINTDASYHLYGEVFVEVHQEKNPEYLEAKIWGTGSTIRLYFQDGEKQFKAFVGQMIKAVANLK